MLHLNSRGQRAPLASISLHATSESCDSGHHDKVPVCIQNLPEAERTHCAVLPWPTHQEPGSCTMDTAQAVLATTVSLCCPLELQGNGHPCTECLLACFYSSTHVLICQASAPAGGGAPFPCQEGQGLRAAEG